jgi:hypothetical protein
MSLDVGVLEPTSQLLPSALYKVINVLFILSILKSLYMIIHIASVFFMICKVPVLLYLEF